MNISYLKSLLPLIFSCFLFISHFTFAHEIRTIQVKIHERIKGEVWDIEMKSPLKEGRTLKVKLFLGDSLLLDNNTISSRYSTDLKGLITSITINNKSFPQKKIKVVGLERLGFNALFQVYPLGENTQNILIKSEKELFQLPKELDSWSTFKEYFYLGVEHILSGYDHLCFVLLIMLIIASLKKIIWAVTAFSVAHGITLTLSVLDVIQFPSVLAEIFIALSIVVLAVEVLRMRIHGKESETQKRPWLVTFIFGLLHGLGFASALTELGLPKSTFIESLVSFNLGIEAGQLTALVIFYVTLRLVAKLTRLVEKRTQIGVAYLAGVLGSFWFITRLVGFFY